MRRKQFIFAAAVIIASGCASNSPSQPAPVEDRMTEIPVEPTVSAERLEIATENAFREHQTRFGAQRQSYCKYQDERLTRR